MNMGDDLDLGFVNLCFPTSLCSQWTAKILRVEHKLHTVSEYLKIGDVERKI
jgi:hypothetical protein